MIAVKAPEPRSSIPFLRVGRTVGASWWLLGREAWAIRRRAARAHGLVADATLDAAARPVAAVARCE